MVAASDINQRLLETLTGRGLDLTLRDGWIAKDETGPAIRADAYVEANDEEARLQLDVEVALPDGRVMTESHATARQTEAEALDAAFQKLEANSLPAILSAFFGLTPEPPPEPWSIGGDPWDVHLGAIGVEIFPAREGERIDPASPPVAPPGLLPNEVRRLVCERQSDLENTSWARFFFAFSAGEAVAAEALWNGHAWPEAAEAISNLDWQPYEGFFALRMFLIVERQGEVASPWPLDYRSTVAAVRQYVALAEAHPKASDDDLCELLIDADVDYRVAEAAAQLVPIAFAYQIFADLELSLRFHIADENNTIQRSALLSQEPSFVAGQEVAAELDAAGRASLATIARRAGIFRAIEFAVAHRQPIPDLEIVVVRDEEGDVAAPSEAAGRPVEAAGAPSEAPDDAPQAGDPLETEPAAKRPWWQFWG